MDNCAFGEWISVPRARPNWLEDGDRYQVAGDPTNYAARSSPDYYWGGTTRIRALSGHPIYSAKPSTPSNEELTQRMEKLVRGMADDAINVHAAFHEAQAIVSDLPKPVDPIDPDEVAAMAIVRRHYPEARDSYRGRRFVVALEAIKLGRTLAAGGTA